MTIQPSGPPRRTLRTLLGIVAIAGLIGCAGADRGRPSLAGRPTVDPKRVSVLMINGGGDRESNYLSHLVHLREFLAVVEKAGVPPERITIFSSDGDDPGADLAMSSAAEGADDWLLDGTALGNRLDRRIEYVSTRIDGHSLRPATRATLEAWFKREGRSLQAGDVLLVFVTDHGTGGKNGPRENAISLWGDDEELRVDQLETLLRGLRPDVRVATLMSQCFSGGFAYLATRSPTPQAAGQVPGPISCGYFSTTAERQAYGCYPENRGVDNVGYAVRVIEGLADTGSLSEAHRHAVIDDQTPDVPLRSSDVFLIERLRSGAGAHGGDLDASADAWLRAAPGETSEPAHAGITSRLVATYGLAPVSSLAEVRAQIDRVNEATENVDAYARAWGGSVGPLASANLDRFLATRPRWKSRVTPRRNRPLSAAKARALRSELASAVAADTSPEAARRLELLRGRAETADEIAYRMRTREAALQRIRLLMLRTAGERQLAATGTAAERAYHSDLARCEDLALPVTSGAERRRVVRAPLPTLEADLAAAATLRPAWMGIQFAAKGRAGAALVERVVPGSPAERAGIRAGDVILGPPGAPFSEPGQIREWTMLAEVQRPYPLEIERGGHVTQHTLVLEPFPVQASAR